MHRVVVVGAIVLAGCAGTVTEDNADAEPVAAPASDEVIQLAVGGGQERVIIQSGQEQQFGLNASGNEAVRFDVEIQRSLAEPSRVAIEVRHEGGVLEHEVVFLNAIAGRGEVATETIHVDVQDRNGLVLVVQSLEGEAEVRVSVQAVEPTPAAVDDPEIGGNSTVGTDGSMEDETNGTIGSDGADVGVGYPGT